MLAGRVIAHVGFGALAANGNRRQEQQQTNKTQFTGCEDCGASVETDRTYTMPD